MQRSLRSKFMIVVWIIIDFFEDDEAAEDDLNEGLACIRVLVGDTAAATTALSCGTNGRDNKELKYLQEVLRLVDSLLCQEARDDFEFVTADELSLAMIHEEMLVNEESDERGEKVVAMKGGSGSRR